MNSLPILSYNLSQKLKENLQKIEQLRRKILLAPIPPETEMRLRWGAVINQVYWSLSLVDNKITKAWIISVLTSDKKPAPEEKLVINYKKALDYIKQDWLVTNKPITPKVVFKLHEIALQLAMNGEKAEKPIGKVLEYLQTGTENPVIQAGTAQLAIAKIKPFLDGNGRIARLLALLFLYKYGYDFRGLLSLEEYWRKDLVALQQATVRVDGERGLTQWLEYFTAAMAFQLEKSYQSIVKQNFQRDDTSRFWELNERQKKILIQLEQPETKITNKKVQQMFNVSQITASRDLTKLATLELLFSHGKGRSVYYTRI